MVIVKAYCSWMAPNHEDSPNLMIISRLSVQISVSEDMVIVSMLLGVPVRFCYGRQRRLTQMVMCALERDEGGWC